MERLSWRKVIPGMRAYDPARGHPVILAIEPALPSTKACGHPASMATACGWGDTPKAGFVKVLDPNRVRLGEFELDLSPASSGPEWRWPDENQA
jgi:hypothetical protein